MSELPLAVRRQVWVQKVNPELFKSYILSLIRQYSLQPPLLGLVTGMKGASTKFKKARAANKALQDIVSACADVAPLYRETLDIIGQAYLDNPSDLALCSLRLQLPLAALEAGTKHVADTDASYKLAKCLVRCRPRQGHGRGASALEPDGCPGHGEKPAAVTSCHAAPRLRNHRVCDERSACRVPPRRGKSEHTEARCHTEGGVQVIVLERHGEAAPQAQLPAQRPGGGPARRVLSSLIRVHG